MVVDLEFGALNGAYQYTYRKYDSAGKFTNEKKTCFIKGSVMLMPREREFAWHVYKLQLGHRNGQVVLEAWNCGHMKRSLTKVSIQTGASKPDTLFWCNPNSTTPYKWFAVTEHVEFPPDVAFKCGESRPGPKALRKLALQEAEEAAKQAKATKPVDAFATAHAFLAGNTEKSADYSTRSIWRKTPSTNLSFRPRSMCL